MKTWFSKDEQKWVSEIPRAFWLGIYDVKTNEKLYSDDVIYIIEWRKPQNITDYKYIKDCSKCNFNTNSIPYTRLDPYGKYTKYPYKYTMYFSKYD